MNSDQPIDLDKQAELMKKYVVYTRKTRVQKLLVYTGYFRLSRYGKYLLSQSNIIKSKPNQELLFEAYDFDVKVRKVFFDYVKKAEIQFKSHLVNAVSLKVNDSAFYLDQQYYTPSKGDNDKIKKKANRKFFAEKFFENLKKQEEELRRNVTKFPELKDYRNGGGRSKQKIPCWAALSYFDFGTVTNIYAYLRGDLRKEVLVYGYSGKNYGKQVTKQMDTWLDATRNLRNVCSHHNKLIGKTSSIVLPESGEDEILVTNTDLFSRIYALRKLLNEKDVKQLKVDLDKIIRKTKFDLYLFGILPSDWKERFDRINKL
ncbi:Abi family protein [Paenibacillus yanchengensis]|uniref:Abi family protein n=1 Tax=Paenibacillus yanchengensis TaxID=2035833 RepID=A0ABW4YFP1_9BACL